MRYISSNPKIMGGARVIAGTRVLLSRIVFLLKEGYTLETIHDMYPHVPLKVLDGAISELVAQIDEGKYAAKTQAL